MFNFVPIKRNLRETLFFCFYLKKSAVENQRMLSEAYGDYTPLISTYAYWFRRYEEGDFEEDKERPDQSKKIKDKEIEALLD